MATRIRRDQIPCPSYLVEGAVRGASLGAIWGGFADLELLEIFFYSTVPTAASTGAGEALAITSASAIWANHRIIRRARVMARSSATFALFLGAFAGGNCVAQSITGLEKDHWGNAFIGGFAGGSAFAGLLNSLSWWRMGALTGSVAAGIRYINSAANGSY